jgi:hypothetical protein
MKKLQIALVAVMLTGSASLAVAQDAQPQGQRGGPNMMASLMQGITLSADQQAKADSIVKKYADQRAAIRADQTLDQDGRRAKSRELMGKQQEELKALLTDDQKKVFEKNVADMQARMQGGGRPPQF